jgi:hypothetical protein
MKGVKYNLVFRKLDGSLITMPSLASADLIITIPHLFKSYYDYDLTCNKAFINTLNTRPHRLNKFVRDRITITRVDKLVIQPITTNTSDTQQISESIAN